MAARAGAAAWGRASSGRQLLGADGPGVDRDEDEHDGHEHEARARPPPG